MDATNCWPPASAGAPKPTPPFRGRGFYSPGTVCPSGHWSACSATGGGTSGWPVEFSLLPSETVVGCCPRYALLSSTFISCPKTPLMSGCQDVRSYLISSSGFTCSEGYVSTSWMYLTFITYKLFQSTHLLPGLAIKTLPLLCDYKIMAFDVYDANCTLSDAVLWLSTPLHFRLRAADVVLKGYTYLRYNPLVAGSNMSKQCWRSRYLPGRYVLG